MNDGLTVLWDMHMYSFAYYVNFSSKKYDYADCY